MTITALGMLLSALAASCSDGGDGKRENPFGNGESFIEVNYSSNADTLFLSWKHTGGAGAYSRLRVTESSTGTVREFGLEEAGCIFTHLPYNEPFKVTFSALDGTNEVAAYRLDARIDGLDRSISKMIIRDGGSITGGDGMYSIALPDGRSVFLMGDSWLGTVVDGERFADHMYRNSYIVYDKGRVSAITDANGPRTSGAVPPGVTDEGKKWYWPGHGFARDGKMWVFQTLMYQGAEGMWGFMYETTHILEYDLPEIRLAGTTPIPFRGSTDVHYGMAVLDDDNFVYIYAQVDVTNDFDPVSPVRVARTTVESLADGWEYYTGSGWSRDAARAADLEGLSSVPVSSQFNVFELDGKYVLLTQKKTFNSGEIYTFTSDTPWGPWKNRRLIFRTYEQNTPGLFTYNAMAHPQFERDGMILVSYNVNTEDFSQQFSDVETYRPRFFWVAKDKILK